MTAEAQRYEELLARGRELTEEQRGLELAALARSPHYPALLASVRRDWESYARNISAQKLATYDGALQHCAGSLQALEVLEGKLRAALRDPKKRAEREEP